MRKDISPPASTTVTIPDPPSFRMKALYWANHFRTVCLLDSNHYYPDKYRTKEWVLAIDSIDEITCGENAFAQLKEFRARCDSDIFGFLSYDLKNQIHHLESLHPDALSFPDLYFFKPRYLLEIKGDKLTVNRNYPETFELIEHIEKVHLPKPFEHHRLRLQSRTNRDQYLQRVDHIKRQIARGDFYELNYCNEFYAEHTSIHPVETFLKLNEKAKAPFSCFFKWHDRFLLCASPERFLKKAGRLIISQPIKGTIRKGDTADENEGLKEKLRQDKKEIAENVMIVDLVRNDLSRTAKEGSVTVEELCGVYEFNTVNQMISTISATLRDEVDFTEAIRNAFPMGSMTGAPKLEVMKNIEHHEDFKRGLYSGSVGYVTNEGDLDLNVVIRSILYHAGEKHLSLRVGSAITADAQADKEYEELLLKAAGLMEVLGAEL